MHRSLAVAVLGANGLILLAVGVLILATARSQLVELGLEADQIARAAPTFYGLGLADAASSLFSLLAMVLVHRQHPAGRTLALVVAANQLVIGVGLYLLTALPLALYFIALRGLVIGAVAWPLSGRSDAIRADAG